MRRVAWILFALALLEGGWLTFDGARAFLLGDYVTPASGEYVGRLGPWADLVSAIGIAPRSPLMKTVHVALGVAWLGVALGLAWRRRWAGRAVLVCAALSLWYLPFGTLLSVVQVSLVPRLPRSS